MRRRNSGQDYHAHRIHPSRPLSNLACATHVGLAHVFDGERPIGPFLSLLCEGGLRYIHIRDCREWSCNSKRRFYLSTARSRRNHPLEPPPVRVASAKTHSSNVALFERGPDCRMREAISRLSVEIDGAADVNSLAAKQREIPFVLTPLRAGIKNQTCEPIWQVFCRSGPIPSRDFCQLISEVAPLSAWGRHLKALAHFERICRPYPPASLARSTVKLKTLLARAASR